MSASRYDTPRSPRMLRTPRKRILIVTEGERTEVDYFNHLKDYLELRHSQLEVHVESSAEGNTPSRVVRSAKALREQAEKRQAEADANGALDARYNFDEVWVVFDTESHSHTCQDLMPAAENAADDGMGVAISRPSFESWFLLHLQDGLPAMEFCADVCTQLRAITRRELSRDYKKSGDIRWFLDHIVPHTLKAIARSRMVSQTAFCSHQHVPSQSGTNVHLLVKVLWDASPISSRQ